VKTYTKTIELYEFDELDDKAKDKARDWYRQGALDYEWWDCTYEDAKTVGLELTGFDLDRNRHATGKFIESAPEVADLILKNHGETCETYKTAAAFIKERDEIVDNAERDEHGELVSEYELDQKLDEVEAEFLRALLEDYSIMLQNESEYLTSDESVDEMITANEYTFDKSGNRQD
jgi:hypothetical protein